MAMQHPGCLTAVSAPLLCRVILISMAGGRIKAARWSNGGTQPETLYGPGCHVADTALRCLQLWGVSASRQIAC